MNTVSLCKWRHVAPEVLLYGLRWYLRYALRSRNVAERMLGRGCHREHTPGLRGGQRSPALDQRCRPALNGTTTFYRVDET